MVLGCNAFANLGHGAALQIRVDEVNAQEPTRTVERLKPHSILVLPRIVAARLKPLDNIAKIYSGLRNGLASVHG